jgi:hypothetical protein
MLSVAVLAAMIAAYIEGRREALAPGPIRSIGTVRNSGERATYIFDLRYPAQAVSYEKQLAEVRADASAGGMNTPSVLGINDRRESQI